MVPPGETSDITKNRSWSFSFYFPLFVLDFFLSHAHQNPLRGVEGTKFVATKLLEKIDQFFPCFFLLRDFLFF